MESVYQFIFEYGSGNVSADLAMIALALVILMQGFFISVLARKVSELDQLFVKLDKSSQAGKLQKLEDNINQFRTEVLRAISAQKPVETLIPQEKADPAPLPEEISARPEVLSADQPEIAEKKTEPELKPETEQKKSIFEGLTRTRSSLIEKIKSVFIASPQLSDEMIEELEAQLVGADLGIALSSGLLADLKTEVHNGKSVDQQTLLNILRGKVESILQNGAVEPAPVAGQIKVIMLVGVNGAGKTTTSAKLAHNYKLAGRKVMLVAADTFRAAAVDQLKVWADKVEVPIVIGAENAKPSTVVFEGMEKAKQENFDLVIVDTAGRLQNKSNLMQELTGVKNAISRHLEGRPQEVLLVVDGSSGQNAIAQAREFLEAAGITGVVVTKLDGTPKGGSVVAIKKELGISVKYVGVGEGLDDLKTFDAKEFAAGLFG